MSLTTLVNPVSDAISRIDTQVAKCYTSLVGDATPLTLYFIVFPLNVFSMPSIAIPLMGYTSPPEGFLFANALQLPDFLSNLYYLRSYFSSSSGTGSSPQSFFENTLNYYNQHIRLPVFSLGSTFLAHSAYHALISSGEDFFTDRFLAQLLLGSGLLSLASSIYLKDTDRSLLKEK